MNNKEFYDRFQMQLETINRKYELESIHDSFIVWFAENSMYLDPEDIVERIVEDTHAEGIDAVLIDERNFTIYFISAKTNGFDQIEKNLPENDVKSTLEGMRLLLTGDYKGKITPELENLVDEYHALMNTGNYETKVLFLFMKKNPIDDKFVRQFVKDFERSDVIFFNFSDLKDFYEDSYLLSVAAPPEKISFTVLTSYLKKENPRKAYVFTCKGIELAKIFNDYKERIFQQNVRLSLGLKSKSINKKIYETAISDQRKNDFWYFNNGITIVCSDVDVVPSGRVTNLRKPQIINGAQTTYALFDAYSSGKLDDNVELLVKVIETHEKEFIENVTLYTNSQNAIRLRDLSSNDEVQIKTQRLVNGCFQYFYERKRGEFDSTYKTPREKIQNFGRGYKKKVISNEKAAQGFLALFLDMPAQSKSDKGRIFVKDSSGFYDQIFNKNEKLLAEKLFLSWKILKFVEQKKKEFKKELRRLKKEVLSGEKPKEVLTKYDSVLHSEYFIIDLMKDFICQTQDIVHDREAIIDTLKQIDENSVKLDQIYKAIKDDIASYTNELRKDPEYYHNKFFKSEKSIGLLREFMHKNYAFIDVML